MTNAKVSGVLTTLNTIDCKMPVAVGFTIAQNIRALETANEIFQRESNRIIAGYAADGQTIKKGEKGFNECRAELEELAGLDADVTLKPIKAEDLEGLNLTLKQINALMEMMR